MFEQLNIKIFNIINHFAGSNIFLDNIGIIFAKYMPIIFIIFLLYLWFNKKRNKNIALYSGYSAVVGLFFNYLITVFYFHPRPFMEHIGTLLIKHSSDTSFPSDHTTFMLSIAILLLYFKNTRKAGTVLFVIGFIGGVARVYSGVHFPLDILGSVVVSIIATSLIFIFKGKLERLNKIIIGLYCKIIRNKNVNT